VIGSIGRLTPQKGYRDFLQAAAQVAARHPQARFLLVGDGEESTALRQSAAELRLADRVVFTGARADVEQLLPLMDLFVSSSLWEGLPTVILEAMLAGVPVVATRVAGTVELIEELTTGRLVPPSDPVELSRVICQLLDSPPQAQEMAQNAQRFVRAHFDIAAVARRQAQMYRQLVTNRADGLKRK
jgi:glycosyltransferase involved in cell wall biosynthesis